VILRLTADRQLHVRYVHCWGTMDTQNESLGLAPEYAAAAGQ
jgi:hypothetical protein